jgi:hypothetical protein
MHFHRVSLAVALLALVLVLAGTGNAATSGSAYTYLFGNGTVKANSTKFWYRSCPSGQFAVGGGYSQTTTNLINLSSGPFNQGKDAYAGGEVVGTAWGVSTENPGSVNETIQLYVICAS